MICLLVLALALSACKSGKENLYHQMPKIDAHVHIRTSDPSIMEFARSEGFKFLTINTTSSSQAHIDRQMVFAREMSARFPDQIFYITTFSMENFQEPGWTEKVLEGLEKDFQQGAIGVTVRKDIGLTFRDRLGNFVFLDDPLFAPILAFMAESGKPLLTHVGEPRNCWLPIDSMTVNNDKNYFAKHPEYHMYLHPEYPSHERLMESRDHVLARYPDLLMVGAHLGSLEWDVDVLAERLERYPNFAVDLAARVCHLQVQDREKVLAFIRKYQDRILYATDLGISGLHVSDRLAWLEDEWRSDWAYFATDSLLSSSSVAQEFTGLNLSEKVLKKIYCNNARNWYSILD